MAKGKEVVKRNTAETIGIANEPQIIKAQVEAIQDLMKSVMIDGEHYGVIEGTSKPTLLKAGAEKIAMMFRLIPQFEIDERPLPNNHVEFSVKCKLTNQDEKLLAEGVGSASTMESKFRFRWTETEKPKDLDAEKRAGRGKWKKKGNKWMWIAKTENPNIWDVRNTVLKIAKKRAFVDAVITATACSDIFTQDIEDLKDNGVIETEETPPTTKKHTKRQTKSEPESVPEPESEPEINNQVPEFTAEWFEDYFKKAGTIEEIKELYKALPIDKRGKGTLAQKEAIAREEWLRQYGELPF